MRQFSIFRLSHDSKGPTSWLMYISVLSMPTNPTGIFTFKSLLLLSWFSEHQNPNFKTHICLMRVVSRGLLRWFPSRHFFHSQVAETSKYTSATISRAHLLSATTGVVTHKTNSPVWLDVSVTRPGLTGPECDRNTCWGFFPLVPLHPLLTGA